MFYIFIRLLIHYKRYCAVCKNETSLDETPDKETHCYRHRKRILEMSFPPFFEPANNTFFTNYCPIFYRLIT